MSFSPPAGTPITLYQYEPVDIAVSYSGTGITYSTAGSTAAVTGLITSTSPYVRLSNSNYLGGVSPSESLVVTATDASNNSNVATYPVSINRGRFTTPVAGSNIVLYLREAMTPITFQTAQLAISQPLTYVNNVPTSLPVGLSFYSNASNSWVLAGTPSVQTVSRNYSLLSLGSSNSSATVTTNVNIVVNPERINLTPPGPTIVDSGLRVGSNIAHTVTASYPYGPGNLVYTWSTLPPGIGFTDISGNPVTSGFVPGDANSTILMSGTVNLNTLSFFRNNNPFTTTLTATRTVQPIISNSLAFQFSFARSVILDITPFPTQYVGVPFRTAGYPYLTAQTYFDPSPTPSAITSITSSNITSNLSVVFSSGSPATATLTGTPTLSDVPGGPTTFRATNAAGDYTDVTVNLPVALDTVTLTSTLGTNSTFVLSRRVDSNALTGYYNAPLSVTAVVGSGNSVTFSAPALAGTGLSLSVRGNTATIVGTPVITKALTSLTITATAALTGATASVTTQFSIINDVITFTDFSLNAIQNVSITPYQIQATSLSGRAVISYTGTNLPQGLKLSSAGRLTGAIAVGTSGTFTVTGSTGFASGSKIVSYTITPDTILLIGDKGQCTLTPNATISANVVGVSYSGADISNFQFSNLSKTYGLTIASNTGVIGGTLISGLPPDNLLPPTPCNFYVTAQAGTSKGSVLATLTTVNPVVTRAFLIENGNFYSNLAIQSVDSTSDFPSGTFREDLIPDYGFYGNDFNSKDATSSNTEIMTTTGTDGYYFRSTHDGNAGTFTSGTIYSGAIVSSVVNKTGTNTWWASGTSDYSGTRKATLFRSDDDGVTWTRGDRGISDPTSGRDFYCRDSNQAPSYTPPNPPFSTPYFMAGTTLRYKDGILLIGGGTNSSAPTTSILRGTVSGTDVTWASVGGPTTGMMSAFSLEDEDTWIAAGSDLVTDTYSYPPTYINTHDVTSNTIWKSRDKGVLWESCSNAFNMIAHSVAYGKDASGNPVWLASGVSRDLSTSNAYVELRYSLDGSNWNVTNPSATPLPDYSNATSVIPVIPLGPVYFDGYKWNVLYVNPKNPTPSNVTLFQHPNTMPFATSNWTSYTVTQYVDPNPRYFIAKSQQYVFPSGPQYATLSFSVSTGTGPVLTYPTDTNLLLYQYMPLAPITLTARSSPPAGKIYFFISDTELPLGISFDPQTQILSGTPVRTGKSSARLFLQDGNGVSIYTIGFTTTIPSVLRPQASASAYTSYIRQYTAVDAAQNARDSHVLPTQTKNLGEFMAPPAPDVTTAVIDAKCKNPNC